MNKFKRAVCLLHQREDGKILAVSRKDDPTKFGLPGGKVDLGESTESAIEREVLEETGLRVQRPRWVFSALCGGEVDYITTTYFAGEISGEISSQESGVVDWVSPETLLKGPFGDYNKRLFNQVGISYKI